MRISGFRRAALSPSPASRKALVRLKAWLTKHSRVILLAVFGLMGLRFGVEGVLALLG